MPRQRTERVLGPYEDKTRKRKKPWRVILVDIDDADERPDHKRKRAAARRSVVAFETEEEAAAYARQCRDEASGRTVNDAVTEYMAYKRTLIAESSATTLEYRLRGILRTDERDRLIRTMTARDGAELYQRRASETKADTHRAELHAAVAMFAWAIKQKLTRSNPFAGVEAVGRRAAGKTQLRVDEARKFVRYALAHGELPGLAAACQVLMGLGPSEVTDRLVRDVDDGGRLFWIERGKTKNRRRHIVVPQVLRERLVAIAKGRDAGAPLWGDVDRHWLGYHVPRLCERAGVTVVTPHSLRGLHSTLSVKAGIEVEHVARQLGHGGPTVTRRHYLAPGAEAEAGQERVNAVLEVGLN